MGGALRGSLEQEGRSPCERGRVPQAVWGCLGTRRQGRQDEPGEHPLYAPNGQNTVKLPTEKLTAENGKIACGLVQFNISAEISNGAIPALTRYTSPFGFFSTAHMPETLALETDLLPLFLRRGHQLADRVKDNLELLVVLLLQVRQLAGKFSVCGQDFA